MGTFLKYVFYVLVIVVIYFVIQGLWTGDINDDTTVKEVVNQVGEDMGSAAKGVVKQIKSGTEAEQ